MKTAVFAGTFDPVTNGHLSVIEKSATLFDKLIVVIGENAEKTPLFSLSDRLSMLTEVCKKFNNVEVTAHKGYMVDFMKKNGAIYYIRGVRNDSDYEYENKMHLFNKSLYPEIVTLFIPCDENLLKVSSTYVKTAIKNGEDVCKYLPLEVLKYIKK